MQKKKSFMSLQDVSSKNRRDPSTVTEKPKDRESKN